MKPQVLIVGAGPTGLALALGLIQQGVSLRIIDKNAGPGTASRAMAVQARTLELYRQFGFAEILVQSGIKVETIQIVKDAKPKAKAYFGEAMGETISRYSYLLSLPQDEHEEILVEQLRIRGVQVEWNTELVSFQEANDQVHVITQSQGIKDEQTFVYLCGCDGSHSSVRKILGFAFIGGTYDQVFFVADVKSTPSLQGMCLSLFEEEFCLAINIRTTGQVRVVGLIPPVLLQEDIPSDFIPLIPYVERNLRIKIERVNWYSPYKVHHRVSEHFRKGRVFLAGDAGHVHSPAGGQGMNTGIGDAINLAWKMAAVLQEKADETILDSYEIERLAFARTLVSTTDRLFQLIAGKGIVTKVYRDVLFPYVIPRLFHFSGVRKKVFQMLSQTQIAYPASTLSEGKAGHISGGDRLPWISTDAGDNYDPLQAVDWQFHVYGQALPALRTLALSFVLPLHEFPWTEALQRVGVPTNASFLVRPDGYIAVASAQQEIEIFRGYLQKWKIKPFHE